VSDDIVILRNLRVLSCDGNGAQISTEADINGLVGAAIGERADLVALPAARLDLNFFDLRTGFAGLLVQKFVNYQTRLAVIGNIADACARSRALKDFVYESNKGSSCWFLNDLEDLSRRVK